VTRKTTTSVKNEIGGEINNRLNAFIQNRNSDGLRTTKVTAD
jgi:hypothetical protein